MGRTVLITGADGFLGSRLASHFAAKGWQVAGLVRNPGSKRLPADLAECFAYSLETGPETAALGLRPDAVIHCAFRTRGVATEESDLENQRAADLLVDTYCGKGDALFVFISSMSAHDGAFSRYGRCKREIERSIGVENALIVRPGFIIGPGGIFQRLVRTLSSTKAAPMPYGGELPIQTADVAELCRALEELTVARATGLFAFGEVAPVPISGFYSALAAWMGKQVLLVPVPGRPVLALARLAEALKIPLPLTSENLLGLKGLIHQPVGPVIARLGWQPSPLSEILKRYDASDVLDG